MNLIHTIRYLYINADGDYYTSPMRQHMKRIDIAWSKTESGYKDKLKAESCFYLHKILDSVISNLRHPLFCL